MESHWPLCQFNLAGNDVLRLIRDRLPAKEGTKIVLQIGTEVLSPRKSLIQQGIVGERARVTYVYVPVCFRTAWRVLHGLPADPLLDGERSFESERDPLDASNC